MINRTILIVLISSMLSCGTHSSKSYVKMDTQPVGPEPRFVEYIKADDRLIQLLPSEPGRSGANIRLALQGTEKNFNRTGLHCSLSSVALESDPYRRDQIVTAETEYNVRGGEEILYISGKPDGRSYYRAILDVDVLLDEGDRGPRSVQRIVLNLGETNDKISGSSIGEWLVSRTFEKVFQRCFSKKDSAD